MMQKINAKNILYNVHVLEFLLVDIRLGGGGGGYRWRRKGLQTCELKALNKRGKEFLLLQVDPYL
jgi:hypothetical protein